MKVQLFTILISLFSSFAFTQTIKPRCLEGNCKNKIGTYIYSDSSIYVGSFSDKLRNGQGKITYKSGATYEGEWLNDKRHGSGVYIDSLKNKYEGAWLDDKENGAGKYTDAKGNVYEGTWTNGELKGYITLRYRNKNLYEGEYNQGIRGKGKFTYADGSVYTGNFAKNKRSGYGEMSYHFGLTFKGKWVSNEIEGQGDFFETSSQKKLASGIWKTEKSKEGDLILLNSDGYMVCYYANKDLYFGQSANLLPHGEGFMGYANGERYEGKFDSGKYNGYGRLLYKDKSEYKGEWKNGQRDGFGALVKKDMTEEKGYWKADKYIGKNNPSDKDVILVDGYSAVQIGNQQWMTQNLNVSRFRNGDIIKEARTEEEWNLALIRKEPAWCYYDNDPKKGEVYGKLYNYYAVIDSRGIAPLNWRVPSPSDFDYLINSLGGIKEAGKKLKSKISWKEDTFFSTGNGTNESGMDVKAGGSCTGYVREGSGYINGYGNEGISSSFWCSNGGELYIGSGPQKDEGIVVIKRYEEKYSENLNQGISIRCVRDIASEQPTEDKKVSEKKFNSSIIIEPTFYGGASKMMSFIQKNLNYPSVDLSNNISGKVELTFMVESDGSITNIRISKGLTETTNAEAIRVVKSMPKWIPGTIDGVKSKQEVTLPINFSTF
jgi:TonB family protein